MNWTCSSIWNNHYHNIVNFYNIWAWNFFPLFRFSFNQWFHSFQSVKFYISDAIINKTFLSFTLNCSLKVQRNIVVFLHTDLLSFNLTKLISFTVYVFMFLRIFYWQWIRPLSQTTKVPDTYSQPQFKSIKWKIIFQK